MWVPAGESIARFRRLSHVKGPALAQDGPETLLNRHRIAGPQLETRGPARSQLGRISSSSHSTETARFTAARMLHVPYQSQLK